MVKLFFYITIATLTFISCTNKKWEKTGNGIIVHIQHDGRQNTRQVRLTVINDDIIRVSATPATLPADKKPTIEENPATTTWKVDEEDNCIILQTASLKVRTNLLTGEVRFTDLNNNTLLQENKGGGKYFTGAIRQVFELPGNEVFYGLEPYQKNTLPFIISNKNYGILWNNNSLSKFGDIRDYSQLSLFKLYDMNGAEGGLTATYYTNSDPNDIYTTRTENTIDYENAETVRSFPKDFPFNQSTIVWEGDLQAKETGAHRFLLYFAGYAKIWIDGKLMTDKWRSPLNPSAAKFNVNMGAGKHHHIRLEWKPDGDTSYIGLKALSPLRAKEESKLSFYSERGEQIDYYFIKGNSMDDVVKRYHTLGVGITNQHTFNVVSIDSLIITTHTFPLRP